ncbi:copper resistance CopC family protein [Brevibacillus sp. H7]|uniref:copper resistance CopC family protein n=1 Tax=Brevibacillus sp. H7 TaxID=3349138 RepID=UPI00382144E0
MKGNNYRLNMWRTAVLFVMVCLALIPTSAFAHTGLEKSTPQNQQVVTEVKEIVLEFETKVEKASTFTVKSEQGEVIEASNIQIDGKVMKGTITKQLQDGTYTVHWKIVGSDGHPIEGDFSFVVKNPKAENSAPPSSQEKGTSANPTNNQTNQSPAENSGQPQQSPAATNVQTPEPSQANNAVFWGAAALVGIALISLVWMMRKKGK